MTITEFLEQYCDEATPLEFYRYIFPEGELSSKGEQKTGKYNALAVSIGSDESEANIKKYIVTDDLEKVTELTKTDDFCIMAPVSYAGKKRQNKNARFIYAMAIDVDGIKTEPAKRLKKGSKFQEGQPIGMIDMFYQFDGNGPSNYLPKPTAIVSSGTGVHIYYIFEKPIPCFDNIVKQLVTLKERLTFQYWTQGLTDLADKVQYESLFQAFRMPGTITKNGDRARVFWIDNAQKVSVEYLNKFVPDEYRCTDFTYKSDLTLAEAKEKYPDWYDRRIVHGEARGRWNVKRDLYDWWLRTVREKAKTGGRYWAVHALATYAVKCNIPEDELERDAISLIPILDELTEREDNHFTKDDVLHALQAYNENYVTYPRWVIAERTMIPIEKNKRNGRKQADHIKLMNFVRDEINHNTEWREGNGRPKGSSTAKNKVYDWRKLHPEGKKIECERETGLSRHTVLKWWDYSPDKRLPEYKDGHLVVTVPKFLNMTNEEIAGCMKQEFEKEMSEREQNNQADS